MSAVAVAVGGSLISGYMQSKAAKSASDAQVAASQQAAAMQQATTQQQLAQQQAQWQQSQTNLQPYMQAGAGATQQLAGMLAPGGSLMQQFMPSQLTMDPSYQWRLEQGMRGLQSSAAARGGLLTGQGVADITNYAQGAASQEYQNAFDRYQAQQTNQYNRLMGLGQLGQASAAGMASTGAQTSANIAQTAMGGMQQYGGYLTGGANAAAAGQIGAANAWGNMLNTGLGNAMTWQYLQKLPNKG